MGQAVLATQSASPKLTAAVVLASWTIVNIYLPVSGPNCVRGFNYSTISLGALDWHRFACCMTFHVIIVVPHVYGFTVVRSSCVIRQAANASAHSLQLKMLNLLLDHNTCSATERSCIQCESNQAQSKVLNIVT